MAQLIRIWHGAGLTPCPRHLHAAHVAFEVACGWEFEWVADREAWAASLPSYGFRLQYGGEVRDELAGDWWEASGLLESRGTEWRREVESELLSLAFFMTSRMEEMNAAPRHFDPHGRFLGLTSMAAERGWLDRPIIDRRMQAWASRMGLRLGESRSRYEVQPTVDVDSAFAYRSKGLVRTAGAFARDVLRGEGVSKRWATIRRKSHDPYDTYDELEKLHAAFSLRARYFFLLADRGPHDRGVPWQSQGLAEVITGLASTADIGIHPGYSAHGKGAKAIGRERERLEKILGVPVQHSRQHYLLQVPPKSWRDLEEAGIEHDHSMGYADVAGFRAGVARPFRAYDLEQEVRLNLWIHPVAVMDATLLRYEERDFEEGVERVRELAEAAAEVGGRLELIWHNESVSNHGEWASSGTFPFYTACLSAALKVAKKGG